MESAARSCRSDAARLGGVCAMLDGGGQGSGHVGVGLKGPCVVAVGVPTVSRHTHPRAVEHDPGIGDPDTTAMLNAARSAIVWRRNAPSPMSAMPVRITSQPIPAAKHAQQKLFACRFVHAG